MIKLMAIGIISYLILMPIIEYFIDNRDDLDADEEDRLTESYK